ncbi:hypothetical protein [Cnuella takakiae]|nr:hypothetical protein [Cnuella takakiae]OLY92912.1 hypothetical protein BUE76_14210 [Cnuella takakiae]
MKNTVRKLILPLILVLSGCGLLFFSTGCSKEVSQEEGLDTGYFFRFTLDGQAKDYKENILAERRLEPSLETIIIQGLADLSTDPSGMLLVLAEQPPVITKTYPEVPGRDAPAMAFTDSIGTVFTNLFVPTASGFELTISQISSGTVRGTFKGQMADANGNIHNVTDGVFYAPFR